MRLYAEEMKKIPQKTGTKFGFEFSDELIGRQEVKSDLSYKLIKLYKKDDL